MKNFTRLSIFSILLWCVAILPAAVSAKKKLGTRAREKEQDQSDVESNLRTTTRSRKLSSHQDGHEQKNCNPISSPICLADPKPTCKPYRSVEHCRNSFGKLVSERRGLYRTDPEALANLGFWFHRLEEKLAGYAFTRSQGFRAPALYHFGELEDLLTWTPAPGVVGYVIRAENQHSNQGIYVLPNGIGGVELLRDRVYTAEMVVADLTAMGVTSIIIEEYISGATTGELPTEYKVHIFNGEIASINVVHNRADTCACWAEVDLDWNRLDQWGCFAPSGEVEEDENMCPLVDTRAGARNPTLMKGLGLCSEIPKPADCLLNDIQQVVNVLGPIIGVYVRIDLFVDAAGSLVIQEYTLNHANGVAHCSARMKPDGCLDPCFMGDMWMNAGGDPQFGGPSTPLPQVFTELDANPDPQARRSFAMNLPSDILFHPTCSFAPSTSPATSGLPTTSSSPSGVPSSSPSATGICDASRSLLIFLGVDNLLTARAGEIEISWTEAVTYHLDLEEYWICGSTTYDIFIGPEGMNYTELGLSNSQILDEADTLGLQHFSVADSTTFTVSDLAPNETVSVLVVATAPDIQLESFNRVSSEIRVSDFDPIVKSDFTQVVSIPHPSESLVIEVDKDVVTWYGLPELPQSIKALAMDDFVYIESSDDLTVSLGKLTEYIGNHHGDAGEELSWRFTTETLEAIFEELDMRGVSNAPDDEELIDVELHSTAVRRLGQKYDEEGDLDDTGLVFLSEVHRQLFFRRIFRKVKRVVKRVVKVVSAVAKLVKFGLDLLINGEASLRQSISFIDIDKAIAAGCTYQQSGTVGRFQITGQGSIHIGAKMAMDVGINMGVTISVRRGFVFAYMQLKASALGEALFRMAASLTIEYKPDPIRVFTGRAIQKFFSVGPIPIWISLQPTVDFYRSAVLTLEAEFIAKATAEFSYVNTYIYDSRLGGSKFRRSSQIVRKFDFPPPIFNGRISITLDAGLTVAMNARLYSFIEGTAALDVGMKYEGAVGVSLDTIVVSPPWYTLEKNNLDLYFRVRLSIGFSSDFWKFIRQYLGSAAQTDENGLVCSVNSYSGDDVETMFDPLFASTLSSDSSIASDPSEDPLDAAKNVVSFFEAFTPKPGQQARALNVIGTHPGAGWNGNTIIELFSVDTLGLDNFVSALPPNIRDEFLKSGKLTFTVLDISIPIFRIPEIGTSGRRRLQHLPGVVETYESSLDEDPENLEERELMVNDTFLSGSRTNEVEMRQEEFSSDVRRHLVGTETCTATDWVVLTVTVSYDDGGSLFPSSANNGKWYTDLDALPFQEDSKWIVESRFGDTLQLRLPKAGVPDPSDPSLFRGGAIYHRATPTMFPFLKDALYKKIDFESIFAGFECCVDSDCEANNSCVEGICRFNLIVESVSRANGYGCFDADSNAHPGQLVDATLGNFEDESIRQQCLDLVWLSPQCPKTVADFNNNEPYKAAFFSPDGCGCCTVTRSSDNKFPIKKVSSSHSMDFIDARQATF